MGDFNLRKWREFIISEDINEEKVEVINTEDITFELFTELGSPILPYSGVRKITNEEELENWKNEMEKKGIEKFSFNRKSVVPITIIPTAAQQDILNYYGSKRPGEYTGD